LSLVITSFKQQRLVASQSKTSSQRTTTGTRTNDNVFVTGDIDGLGEASSGGQQAKQMRKNHIQNKE
jgi:hypothetical protein